jgi:hypothetical protein
MSNLRTSVERIGFGTDDLDLHASSRRCNLQ